MQGGGANSAKDFPKFFTSILRRTNFTSSSKIFTHFSAFRFSRLPYGYKQVAKLRVRVPRVPVPKNTPRASSESVDSQSMMRKNGRRAHKNLTICRLPYMDGFNDCITAFGQGQLIFSTQFGTMVRLFLFIQLDYYHIFAPNLMLSKSPLAPLASLLPAASSTGIEPEG